MSQFNITIEVGGSSVGAIQIDPGESFSGTIVYRNADGSVRSMVGATVKCDLYTPTDKRPIFSANLSSVDTLVFTPAQTAGWPKKTMLQGTLTETSNSGNTVLRGKFQIQVGDV